MSEPTANSAGVPPKPKVRKFKIVSVSTNGGGNSASATTAVVAPSATPKSSTVTSETPASPTPVTAASTPSPSHSPAAPATAPRQRYTATSSATDYSHRTYQPPMVSPYGSPQQQYMAAGSQWPVPPMPFMGMPTAQPWWQSSTQQQQYQHAGSVSPPQRPQGGSNNNNKSPQQHQRPHSPVRAHGGSGGKPPPQSNVIGTSVYIPQRNGMRIERSLEGASRDDLMQIIVELCFMNKSAAEYVESKAQLLSLCAPSVASMVRKDASSSSSSAVTASMMEVSENTPVRGTNNPNTYDADDASFATPGTSMPLMGASPLGATGASIAATYGEMSPRLDEYQTPMQRRPAANSSTEDNGSPVSNPSTASPARQHNADSTTASPVASRSSANTSVSTTSCDRPPREPASRRAFHADKLHPCMYVYGACRHPVSCPNAKLPFNLCLSWLRGVCHAGESCTMVHRLPDNCSEQVRLIHTLQEDDSHEGVLRSTPSLASRLFDTAKKLANQRNIEAQQHHAVNVVDVSASTTPTEAPSPMSTNNDVNSPHTLEREEKSHHGVDDATCPKQVESQITPPVVSPTIAAKMPVAVAPEAATVARALDLYDH